MSSVSPDVRGAYFGSMDRAFEGFTYVGNAGSRLMHEVHGSNAGSIGGSMNHHAHRRPSASKGSAGGMGAFGKGPAGGGHH